MVAHRFPAPQPRSPPNTISPHHPRSRSGFPPFHPGWNRSSCGHWPRNRPHAFPAWQPLPMRSRRHVLLLLLLFQRKESPPHLIADHLWPRFFQVNRCYLGGKPHRKPLRRLMPIKATDTMPEVRLPRPFPTTGRWIPPHPGLSSVGSLPADQRLRTLWPGRLRMAWSRAILLLEPFSLYVNIFSDP